MKNLLALIVILFGFIFVTSSLAYGAEIKVDMLNKRADGQKMVYSQDVINVKSGDSVTWLPKSKGHNVEFIKVPEGVKKIKKSKLLKTIALVGAALVTGGAAVGAFGGTFAQTAVGKFLTGAATNITNFLGPAKFIAKPFEMAGTLLGTGAGKLTDALGMGEFTGRAAADVLPAGVQKVGEEAGKEVAQQSFFDTTLGKAVVQTGVGLTTSVGSGYLLSKYNQQDPTGAVGPSLGEEQGLNLSPLQIAYADAGIDMKDIYGQLTYGTADPGFLASRYGDLYQQQTLSLGAA